MRRFIILGVVMMAIAVEAPQYLEQYALKKQNDARMAQATQGFKNSGSYKSTNPLEGRIEALNADQRGHFITTARLNGRRHEVLVDTGATYVSMNEAEARRLGIKLKPSDFKHTTRTANGKVRVALTTIEEVRIGRVSVQNVQAVVTQGQGLESILLGMSFLGRLKSFRMSNGQLVLEQ